MSALCEETMRRIGTLHVNRRPMLLRRRNDERGTL
jgi:hypothetical protein